MIVDSAVNAQAYEYSKLNEIIKVKLDIWNASLMRMLEYCWIL